MWIQTGERHVFPLRRRIVQITREMMVNAGLGGDLLLRFASSGEFNEDVVRKLLAETYGSVSTWTLHVAIYNAEWSCIEVLVESPDFDEVEPGCRAPRFLPPTTLHPGQEVRGQLGDSISGLWPTKPTFPKT